MPCHLVSQSKAETHNQGRHSFLVQTQKAYKKGLSISFTKAFDLAIFRFRLIIFLIKKTYKFVHYLVRKLPA